MLLKLASEKVVPIGFDGNSPSSWISSLPISVQAQANPCNTTEEGGGDVDVNFNCDFEGICSLDITEAP
jgi:hypothetical protein